MRIHVYESREIDLPDEQVEQVFESRLDQLCGGKHVHFKGKEVVEWTDTGHGSGLTEKVKKPTPLQIAALKFREAWREDVRKKLRDESRLAYEKAFD